MAMKIRRLQDIPREELFVSGHGLCAGCGIPPMVKIALKAIDGRKIVVNATGCLEVASTHYPHTAWKLPWVHNAFENAAATASGIEAAIKVLNRKRGFEKYKIITFGGDGGTFDIGIQALSGALERGHNFIYICYDNEAYMNTGIQRSGGTPLGASTTTSPAGKAIPGKQQTKKSLMDIVIAHMIPYAATLNPAYPVDMWNKFAKASDMLDNEEGPIFFHYYSPCPVGWRMDTAKSIRAAKLAVQTRLWPLYEVDHGKLIINVKISRPKPIEDYLKIQGRFKHLLKPVNSWMLDRLKEDIERNWSRLQRLSELESLY
jgi:pyruvate ferredoxin oxidoreductase beta subunit